MDQPSPGRQGGVDPLEGVDMNSLLQDFRGQEERATGATTAQLDSGTGEVRMTPPVGPTISTLEMMNTGDADDAGAAGNSPRKAAANSGQSLGSQALPIPNAEPNLGPGAVLEERLMAFYQLRQLQARLAAEAGGS